MKLFKQVFQTLLLSIVMVNFVVAQEQTRSVSNFKGVQLGMPAQLYIKQGNTSSVVIDASEEALEHIKTEVRGDLLVIKLNNDWNWWKSFKAKNVKIYITNPTFNHVSISGSGNIQGENTLQSKTMYVGISGSGKVNLMVKTVDLEGKISGSGNLDLSGSARNTQMHISGSGSIDAEDLVSQNCEIRISGSGSCRVQVDNNLDSKISGSGNIYYRGNPEKLSNKSSGSGSIKKIG